MLISSGRVIICSLSYLSIVLDHLMVILAYFEVNDRGLCWRDSKMQSETPKYSSENINV